MLDIVGMKINNYTVTAYNGKQNNKHYYTIIFDDTKNEYLEERTKVRLGKAKDIKAIKLKKQLEYKEKLLKKSRLSKKYVAEYKKIDMKDKKILALDQASTTGYCIINNNSILTASKIDAKYENFYQNAYYIMQEVEKIIIKNKIKILIIEDVYLGLNANVLEKLSALKGCMVFLALKHDLEFECVKSQSWKSYHGIKGDRKEQKQQSLDKVRAIMGIDIQNDNIADAVLLGIYAAKELKK